MKATLTYTVVTIILGYAAERKSRHSLISNWNADRKVKLADGQFVSPPRWPRLKYFHKYWMNCHEIWDTWSTED